MVLGPVIRTPAAGGPEPTGSQLPFFHLTCPHGVHAVRSGHLVPALRTPYGAPGLRRLEGEGVGDALSIGWLMAS